MPMGSCITGRRNAGTPSPPCSVEANFELIDVHLRRHEARSSPAMARITRATGGRRVKARQAVAAAVKRHKLQTQLQRPRQRRHRPPVAAPGSADPKSHSRPRHHRRQVEQRRGQRRRREPIPRRLACHRQRRQRHQDRNGIMMRVSCCRQFGFARHLKKPVAHFSTISGAKITPRTTRALTTMSRHVATRLASHCAASPHLRAA